MVMYLYVVDIYEDEPLLHHRRDDAVGRRRRHRLRLRRAGTAQRCRDSAHRTRRPCALNGVVLPLLEGLLMIAGPLFLLPQRRFNDVLDGATFGAASAVAFAGTHVIIPVAANVGRRPSAAGDPLTWVIQLISLGVLQPVIAAGAIGSAAAAFWLRYRSPDHRPQALGHRGRSRAGASCGGGAARRSGPGQDAAAAHPGNGRPGPDCGPRVCYGCARRCTWASSRNRAKSRSHGTIVCPNCGHSTPEHTFCGHCGVALRALPRSRRNSPPAPAMPTTPATPAAGSEAGQ